MMREPTKQARYGNLYLEGTIGRPITFVAEQSIVLTGDLLVAGGMSGTTTVGLVAGGSVEVFHPRMIWWTGAAVAATGEAYWRQDGLTTIPYWPRRYATSGPDEGLRVQAAILALGGSFQVQQWSEGKHHVTGGSFGELRVEGSVAQRFRGAVGKDPVPSCHGCEDPETGYWKHYTYDERLRRGLRPPYFPAFETTTWSVLWTEEHATDPAVRAP